MSQSLYASWKQEFSFSKEKKKQTIRYYTSSMKNLSMLRMYSCKSAYSSTPRAPNSIIIRVCAIKKNHQKLNGWAHICNNCVAAACTGTWSTRRDKRCYIFKTDMCRIKSRITFTNWAESYLWVLRWPYFMHWLYVCRCFVLYKSVSFGQKKSKVLTAFTAVDFHVVRTREKTSFQHKGGGVGPDLVATWCGDDPTVVRIATNRH